jgi:predicted ester cyclase
MSTANEDLSRRFFDEVCNARNLDVADEIIAADFVSHIPQSPPAHGPDGVKASVAVYQDALDGYWDVQETHAVGDRTFTRWIGRGTHVGEFNGIAPTGREITVEALTEHRIADGKIAEDWTVWDALGLLQQLGAVPVPA